MHEQSLYIIFITHKAITHKIL